MLPQVGWGPEINTSTSLQLFVPPAYEKKTTQYLVCWNRNIYFDTSVKYKLTAFGKSSGVFKAQHFEAALWSTHDQSVT